MPIQAQDETVAFLSNPATYGGVNPVEVVETHAAFVFLAGDEACKIKRSVRYDYLDFSTLSRRHDALQRELELNAPAAASIYRDVVPITRGADGELQFDGDGEPVEWVLRMHRFPAENELARVAERGALDLPLAEALGQSVARYHAMAPQRKQRPGSALIGGILEEFEREFAGLTQTLPPDEIETFLARAGQRLALVSGLLDARVQAGHVKRCHGDLHLGNIVVIDGKPVPFDALEFDEELGTCDVLYDLAFVLMDLHHRGLDRAANQVLNQYLRTAESDEHLDGLAALPLFIGVRAGIRAMVSAQLASAGRGGSERVDEARRYLGEAIEVLSPAAPVLVAVGGLSGTGKTTLARTLAPKFGPLPGAIHLRSDLERKALWGVDPLTRLPEAAYDADVTARVYAQVIDKARCALKAGQAVMADAVYLQKSERDAIEHIAVELDVPFTGLWLESEPGRMLSRVSKRTGDASDADAKVVQMQLDRDTGVIDWLCIDASGPVETTVTLARRALGLVANGKPESRS